MQEPISKSPLSVYQDYLADGVLAYQYSEEVGRAIFFPRVACPYSGSRRLSWRVSDGRGVVYATTVVYPREGQPYNVALIDVEEGFRMMSRVEGVPPQDVAIGMAVQARVIASVADRPPLVVFDVVEGGKT